MSRRRRNKVLPPAVQELVEAARPVLQALLEGSQPPLRQINALARTLPKVEALDGVWYDRALHDQILADLRAIHWDTRKVGAMLRMLARASGIPSEEIAAALGADQER